MYVHPYVGAHVQACEEAKFFATDSCFLPFGLEARGDQDDSRI